MNKNEIQIPIIIDTREQKPYGFPAGFCSCRKALPAGDYSLEGFETRLAFERKSLDDFVKSVINDRKRFYQELEHLTLYDEAFVIVEASWDDIMQKRYTSGAHPNSVWGFALDIMRRFSIPVLFLGDRQTAVLFMSEYFKVFWKKYAKEREKERKNEA